jgi:choice-of-anchor B domain-containing protein
LESENLALISPGGLMFRSALAAVTLLVYAMAVPVAAQEPNFGRAIVATDTELFIGQPVNWYGPGVVYTYRADAAGRWVERSRLTATDTARMDDFGRSIAVDGNTLIVGAPRKRDGAGVAYTFTRNSANAPWSPAATVAAPAAGEFGSAIILNGNDLLIGAPTADATGAVYHFRRGNSGWQQLAVIRPAGPADGSSFGGQLSMAGDWLLIGAATADSNAGRAYLARRNANGTWGEPTAVNLPTGRVARGARAGGAVHLTGSSGYIGAPGAGVVFRLERDAGDSWRVVGELSPYDGARGTQFGQAIASVGDELWVGAPGTNRGTGRVYRFLSDGADDWRGVLRFEADSADGTSWPFMFGYAMAATGGKVIVGMPMRDFGEGRVVVASRLGDNWQEEQQLTGEIFAIDGGRTPAAKCTDGKVGAYTCSNVEVVAHLPVSALGGERGVWVNDVWGWTDPATNRDYALVARRDGASFVEVTNPSAPRLVGNLPRTAGAPPSVWRDIKVIGNHAYIVADGAGAHGMQVFDLTRLRAVQGAPVTFAPDTTYREIFSAHNVVADTASRFLYVVGSNSGGTTCGGGLHMVDARNPTQLRFAGCYHNPAGAGSRGYTHDAQCLVYRGPDARYHGRQICVGSNESEINIADVTDKSAPKLIGRNSYPNVSYAHQGWFDDEQRYFYMNDEGDELAGLVEGTRTIVWDLSELDDPVVAHMYIGPVRASDHNLFVKGNRVFESNYGSGLRVLDISDRTNPREVGFFDSAPFNQNDPGHSSTQSGAWSNYPFFKGGVVIFTSVREGLFIVRVDELVP